MCYKCADIDFFGVVKIKSDCEEGLNKTEQQSKVTLRVNNCRNLPKLMYKLVGPGLIMLAEE